MANFDTANQRRESLRNANNVLAMLLAVYTEGKQVQSLMALYTAGSDPVLVAAVNAIFSPAERAEIAAMMTQIGALVVDWEANHRGALGLAP